MLLSTFQSQVLGSVPLPSAELRRQVQALSSAAPFSSTETELRETVQDYLFELATEGQSSKQRLESLAELVSQGNSPFVVQDFLDLLQSFHVETEADLKLLHRLLILLQGGDQERKASSILKRLAFEVQSLHVSDVQSRQAQAETLFYLQGLERNRDYAKQIGQMALEAIAAVPTVSVDIRRDAVSHILYSYCGERPLDEGSGALLVRSLVAAIKIAEDSNDKNMLRSPEMMFPELARRCDVATVINLQQSLVRVAQKLQMDEKTLFTLRWQLGYAYLLAQNYSAAELHMRESAKDFQSLTLLAQLQLTECLRREGKMDECNALSQQIEKLTPSSRENFSADYTAGAKTILAELLISSGRTVEALPILESAIDIYEKSRLYKDLAYWNYPKLSATVPTEQSALALAVAAYKEVGRSSDAVQMQKKLDQLDLSESKRLASEKATMIFEKVQRGEYDVDALSLVREYVELLSKADVSEDGQIENLLALAASLIDRADSQAAEFSLAACSERNPSPLMRRRILCDKVKIAEFNGDFELATRLISEVKSSSDKSDEDSAILAASLLTRLQLLLGNYDGAIDASRLLESALLSKSEPPVNKVSATQDNSQLDTFILLHQSALLDRARALMFSGSLQPALSQIRLCISVPGGEDESTNIDAYVLLAKGYRTAGHAGLAAAACERAINLMRFKPQFRPSLMLADARLGMAEMAAEDGNKIRAKRYFAGAVEVAKECHLDKSTFYKRVFVDGPFKN
ncbi:MAG: hypothetical protein U0103_22430 [Candidatus Obscuribacterales bacterium]